MNKLFTVFAFAFFLQTASAQITLSSTMGWTPGDPYTVQVCNPTSAMPSTSGSNISVDYSSVTNNGDPITASYTSSGLTPYSSLYIAANVALPIESSSGNTSYEYFSVSNTKAELWGIANNVYSIVYSDPQLAIKFPTAYNDTYSDVFSGNYEVNGISVNRNGSIQVNADAYGSIKTPKGTYPYLRLKMTQHIVDTFIYMGDVINISIQDIVTYDYMNNNIKDPVFSYSESTTDQGVTTSAYYYNGNTTGLNENIQSVVNGIISPNPAHKQLSVSFNMNTSDELIFKIYDLNGKLVGNSFVQTLAKGSHIIPIDISDLSSGLYSLVVESTNGNRSVLKFIAN